MPRSGAGCARRRGAGRGGGRRGSAAAREHGAATPPAEPPRRPAPARSMARPPPAPQPRWVPSPAGSARAPAVPAPCRELGEEEEGLGCGGTRGGRALRSERAGRVAFLIFTFLFFPNYFFLPLLFRLLGLARFAARAVVLKKRAALGALRQRRDRPHRIAPSAGAAAGERRG